MFHFTCFNVEDPHDPAVGLVHGDLAIPGNLLRREVFDPVVQQVRAPPLRVPRPRADTPLPPPRPWRRRNSIDATLPWHARPAAHAHD